MFFTECGTIYDRYGPIHGDLSGYDDKLFRNYVQAVDGDLSISIDAAAASRPFNQCDIAIYW